MLDGQGNCLVSPEFNGDMGDSMANGKVALASLSHCSSEAEFKSIVLDFIIGYGYGENYDSETLASGKFVRLRNLVEDTFQNVERSYFNNWFSDYLYVANAVGADIHTKDYNGADLVLKAGHVSVLNFGKFVRDLPMSGQTPSKEEGGKMAMTLLEAVRKQPIEISAETDSALVASILGIIQSGVETVRLVPTEEGDRVEVDPECCKSIACECVKLKALSDKGDFRTKTEARQSIECSTWMFPCPDYKYSNVKRNLERAICSIHHIRHVEVKSFITGILEYD